MQSKKHYANQLGSLTLESDIQPNYTVGSGNDKHSEAFFTAFNAFVSLGMGLYGHHDLQPKELRDYKTIQTPPPLCIIAASHNRKNIFSHLINYFGQHINCLDEERKNIFHHIFGVESQADSEIIQQVFDCLDKAFAPQEIMTMINAVDKYQHDVLFYATEHDEIKNDEVSRCHLLNSYIEKYKTLMSKAASHQESAAAIPSVSSATASPSTTTLSLTPLQQAQLELDRCHSAQMEAAGKLGRAEALRDIAFKKRTAQIELAKDKYAALIVTTEKDEKATATAIADAESNIATLLIDKDKAQQAKAEIEATINQETALARMHLKRAQQTTAAHRQEQKRLLHLLNEIEKQIASDCINEAKKQLDLKAIQQTSIDALAHQQQQEAAYVAAKCELSRMEEARVKACEKTTRDIQAAQANIEHISHLHDENIARIDKDIQRLQKQVERANLALEQATLLAAETTLMEAEEQKATALKIAEQLEAQAQAARNAIKEREASEAQARQTLEDIRAKHLVSGKPLPTVLNSQQEPSTPEDIADTVPQPKPVNPAKRKAPESTNAPESSSSSSAFFKPQRPKVNSEDQKRVSYGLSQ